MWLAQTSTTEQDLAKFIAQNPELMDFWYAGETGPELMNALADLQHLKYVNIKIPHVNNLDSSVIGNPLSCLGEGRPRANKMRSAYLDELGGDPNLVTSLQSFMRSNHLLSFGINNCTLPSDSLVEALTADPTPTSLGVSNIPNLSYETLDQILFGLPALISINISGSNSLTSADITNIRAKYPWVEVVLRLLDMLFGFMCFN